MMKKTLYWIVAFLLIFATNAMVAQNSRDNGRAKTIKLDKKSFLKRVANYEESPTVWKYLGDKPAVIDFYADWCGPCKMLAPVIETLATEQEGKVKVGKLNVDDSPETAQKYGIMSIPTLLYIKNGEVVNKTVGVVSKTEIEQILSSL